jgi:hypothetical protein
VRPDVGGVETSTKTGNRSGKKEGSRVVTRENCQGKKYFNPQPSIYNPNLKYTSRDISTTSSLF